MPRYLGRMGLAVVILVVMTAGMASAYDYTILGEKPDWWDDPALFVKAEWKSWDVFIDDFGPAPDVFETNFHPFGPLPDPNKPDERWRWSTQALIADNVEPGLGMLVKGHEDEWDFNLLIGNRNLVPIKQWYLEFELDRVPSPEWDEARFNADIIGRYVGDPADHLFNVLASDWKELVDGAGNPYLVWWGLFELAPQPDLDKFNWKWNTNHTTLGVDDFRVRRVTTGTNCTPEPVSLALLALGLPLGLWARRRR